MVVSKIRNVAVIMLPMSNYGLLKWSVDLLQLNIQIVLLDEDGRVLGSRHLKSGESIESGKKCHFPNYLIEICEAENQKQGQFVHTIVCHDDFVKLSLRSLA